jgi:hypothetical protein
MDEKPRFTFDLNLRASEQHLLGGDIFLFTPKFRLGAAPQPKSRVKRLYIQLVFLFVHLVPKLYGAFISNPRRGFSIALFTDNSCRKFAIAFGDGRGFSTFSTSFYLLGHFSISLSFVFDSTSR